MNRAFFLCALALSFAMPVRPAAGQGAPYKIAEAELAIDGLSAEVEGANPAVPKNVASGLRVIVRAGGQALSAEEAAAFLGPGFEVRAELAGPGLRQSLRLPQPGGPPQDDPFLLHIPGLTVAGDYSISGLRIGQGTRTLLDAAPRQVTLRVIAQVLITSVQTRPLTMAELQDKGVLVDHESYLGFEFTIALLLESEPITVTLPVVFNRRGVPLPPTIPLPPPIRREHMPLIVPVLFGSGGDEPPGGDDGGGGGGGGGGGPAGLPIPSVLVIPGNVGYLKQHFSAQLFVANGAPAGSTLSVRDVVATIALPPGADAVPGTDDDPLILAPLVDRPPTAVLPVRGVGPDGEPGTADDVDVLNPGALGQAEFLLRGEREGFHNIGFDIAAVLEGLPTGAVSVTGRAKGAVLVRNALFDMAFTVPNVVRAGEPFKLVATVSNIGRGDANDLNVTIDQARMSGLRILGEGTLRIPHLPPGDAANVTFEFESQRTGQVVASYLHLDTAGTGRLNFTVGIGERGVPLSPDTLVLPTSVQGLPPDVVAAAMRVLGQAWSVANAPPERLRSTVLRVPAHEVLRKLVALAEAGLRVDLGQPLADAVRDLAFDFYGGSPLEPGFDQLLRETAAGRNLAFALGAALAGAAGTAGSPAAYERSASEVAAAGADFVAVSVRGTGGPVGATLSDSAGRQTVLGRSAADLSLTQIPGAAFLPLGAPASAPTLGLVTAPTLAPYTLEASGPAELSVTFPRGDGTFQHGTITTAHPARIVMDFASPHTVVADEDTDGDGSYETRRDLVRDTLASQGPRLISAHVVGPETVAGASLYGVHAALLFDRIVGEEAAAEKGRYQVAANEALSAKRQLSGRLVFLGLAQPEGNYVPATVSLSGLPDTRGITGPAGNVPLTSRLRAIGAVVSGHVVNADGTPFTGGPVFYSQYTTQHVCGLPVLLRVLAAVRPDPSGRYEFRYVPRDPCGVPFEMAVYDPVTGGKRAVQLYVRTAGERMVADLAIMGRGTVAGAVRSAAGDPVGGALVVAYSVTDPLVTGHATTGGDGRYTIPNITVGGVNVRAVQGILVGQAAGRIDRAGGTATVDLRLEGGSARLTGRVFKLEDGETTPLPAAYVQYRLASGSPLLGLAQTDPAGRYVLEGMPAGNFLLSVNLNSRDRAAVAGHADEGQVLEDLDLVVVIPPESQLGSVRGTVRFKDGRPAPGVLVSVYSRGTLSAADGSYEITGLAVPSNPSVLARTQDDLRSGWAYAFLTASNPRPTGIDITLSGDGNAEFTVLDPAGQPLPGQTVTLDGSCANPCGCARRVSDSQGRVRFEGLRLGGSRVARALRFANGVQDVAHASVTVTRDGETAYGVLRFGGAGTVRGVVREEGTANPVHGAKVSLMANRFFRNDWICGLVSMSGAELRTDVQGRFEFTAVNAGPATAFAVQEFFGSSVGSAAGTVAHGQELALQVSLRNTMAGGLSGTVFHPDGVTPVGPGVEATVNGMLPDVTVLTNADGYYEFAEILPQGHYTLTVRHASAGRVARQRIYLRAQQDAVHDVRLLGEGTVEVTVADGAGDVVESANVQLRQTEYPFRTYSGVVHPANQGVVRFEEVVEGPFTVEASDVYGRGGRGSGRIAGPGETVAVRVRLTVTGVVRGRFLMPGGAPIPYGTVRLTASGRAIGQVTTQGSAEVGSFAFDYVPAGPVRLDAEDPATARTGLAVGTIESEEQELTLDVRAQALGTVRGLVTGDGTPQPGALVTIVSGTYRVATAADSEGWYEVPGIPEGRIVVTASLDGGYLKATASGTLAGEGSTLQVDVALRPSGEVRGTVVEAVGETPARAAVTVGVGGWGSANFTQHTTEDGRFDFTRVAAGAGTLKADALGSIDLAEAAVQVPAGGVVEVPMRLNGVGSLRGRALASDGTTPTGGYLALNGGTDHGWNFTVRLGPDGLFHLPEVLAGPVTASLRVDGSGFTLYGTASGTIPPGQEAVLDVQVQASGTVTGVVVRAGGSGPAFGATVTLQHQRGTVHTQAQGDGRFTFRGVPLGGFTLTVHDEVTTGRATVRNQQVASNGQTVDLGTIELDAVPPTLEVAEPADGSSRPPLGGTVTVDLADAHTGIDTSSFRVVYASGSRQNAPEFTFEGGQARGRLRAEWQAVGANVVRFEVQDLAGNLTQRTVTYTATGATLQGVVRNHDGSPAPGAQVFVGSMGPAGTDGAGAYARGGIRPGGHVASAVNPATGLTSAGQWLMIADGATHQRDFAFAAFGVVHGIVRHADGSPAPGATVSILSPPRSVTAGPGGAYSLGALPLGTHDLTASEPARGDRGTARVTLNAAGQTVAADIRLNGVGTVTATVRNTDGSVVPGALVRASSSSALGWWGAELSTPAGGTVSWNQALAGTITVTARDPARNLAGQATGLLQDNGNVAITVTLEPAGTVEGTVYRAGGTVPAEGVEVTIGGNRSVVTGTEGRYAFPNVPLAAFQLVARDPSNGDRASGSGVVSAAGSTVTVDLTLTGVGQVRVTVRKASGAPGAGAEVLVWRTGSSYPWRSTSGEDGAVSFADVLAGALSVTANLPQGLGTGSATATLAPGQDLDVIVTLGATGTIRGRVLLPDGTTPAAGVTLSVPASIYSLVYATSAADGAYEFPELPLRGAYLVKALVNGRTHAQSPNLTLSTAGQVVVHDLVLVGAGTVAGLITDPAGNPADGAEILLRVTSYPYATDFRTTTGSDGRYSVAEVPLGPFTVTASRPALGQSVDRSAEITSHGEAMTIDLQLLSSFVTLPLSLADGNQLTWSLQTDGSVRGAYVVASLEKAAKLSLVENGTLRPFTGAGSQAASEEAKREVVIRQGGLAGLNVTRKVFVPVTGYFIRYLDVLENPEGTPITVDVLLESQHTFNSRTPSVVDSASGDTTPEPEDAWLLLDDADTQHIDDTAQAPFAPLGVVLSGANGLRPSVVAWNAGSHTATYRWDGVTVPPGQAVAFLHLMTPQSDRDRGRASAIRLSEGPPEAWVGLSPEEAGAIRNFVVPANLASSLEPLPPLDGVINGKLLGGDGLAPVPGRVKVRSRSPHYGRLVDSRYDTGPDGSFQIYGTLTEGIKLLPRTEFDLTASVAEFGTQAATVPGGFAQTGVRNLADVTGRTIIVSTQATDAYSAASNAVDGRLSTYWKAAWPDSAEPPHNRTPFLEVVLPADATIHEVRVRSSLAWPTYLIRRARVQVKSADNAVLWSADVDLDVDTGAVDVPVPSVAGARRVRVTSLADATMPTITELEIMGEGPSGPSRETRQDLLFAGRGVLEGRLLREDGSTIAAGQVKVPPGDWVHTRTADASGFYRFPVVPPGSYTVTGVHPLGDHSVTVANVPVAADQKTTQDLAFASLGRLTGATLSAGGQPVNATHRLEGPGLTRLLQAPAATYTFPDVPAGAYTLTSTDQRSQGAVSVPVTITADTTTTQDVTFPPVGTVVVTATVNGQPLVNGPVYWTSSSRTTQAFAGYTNVAGQLTILNVSGPTFTVEVRYPGFPKSFGETTAALPSEAATVPVSVAVPGLGTVTGTVRSRGGVAQPNAAVTILHATDDNTTFGTATANASGLFNVNNVPVGPFRLRSMVSLAYGGYQVMDTADVAGALTVHGQTLSLDGLVPRGALTASSPAALWEYTLAQGADGEIQAIAHVHSSDAALADPRLEVYGPGGTLVAANDDRSDTDKNPRIQFTASQAGTYLAVVKATGTGGYRLGSPYNTRVFRPYVGTTATGHALREGSGTLANATIRLTAAQAGGLTVTPSVVTPADGSFQFTTVPAQATLTVELVEGGLVVGRASGSSGATGTTVDLPVVRPGLGQVEVRTTYRGAPFGTVEVQLVSNNAFAPESLTTQSGITAADGRWAATPVPAGTVTAQATDPITGAPVEASGTLADGGALTLELTFSDGGDTVPPGAVGDLAASAPSIGLVRLSWTAPGDDGGTGTAAAYDVRYSTAPIDAANFASAIVAPAPAPAPAGTIQTFDLTGLAPNATYYLALKARDEAYNWSALSNVAQVGTAGLPTAGLKLWLKTDVGVTLAGGTSYVSGWQDQSGQGNHATQGTAASQPLLVPGEVNGLPVLRFDGTNDWLAFATRLTTIRTVFWVVRENPAAPNGTRYLLGDASAVHFQSDGTHIWYSGYTSSSILNGETRLNGTGVNGTATDRPTALTVISLVTTAPVTADSFSRSSLGRYWFGDLAELVIYDRLVGDAERTAVEAYLARKYGLYAPPLPAPLVVPSGGTLSAPTLVTLQAEPGAEIRYTLDGSEPQASSPLYTEPLSVNGRTTLKAKAFASGWSPSPATTVTFLASADFSPASVGGLKLWVRADAAVEGSATTRVGQWSDQSGQANHLAQSDVFKQPLLLPNAAAGLPALTFDGANDWLGFATRLTTVRTVFWVVRESAAAPNGYRFLLGDTVNGHFSSDNTHRIWSTSASTSVLSGQTRLNGTLVNGTTTNRPTGSLSLLSLVTTGPVTAASFASDRSNGRHWWGELAELVVYDTALSDTDRRAVEEYMAARYGITLP